MHVPYSIIGRESSLFGADLAHYEEDICQKIRGSKFLVLGGAGSIGQSVTKEIFKRNPKKLHVIDVNENNIAELSRDIRSSYGYISGDFQTFAIDVGSEEFNFYWNTHSDFDYILNLSALKHVRSEKDPYTLMRMINVNVLNTHKTLKQAIAAGVKNYFCVSTDKASAPVNLMGASKRLMEMVLFKHSSSLNVTTARFANVAFSDGSLLDGFEKRILKGQPIAAPNDIKRYFMTQGEAGELCLLACLLGKNRDIFYPKVNQNLSPKLISEVAKDFIKLKGFSPHICSTEADARNRSSGLIAKEQWPCYFSPSDTTGEKDIEEFFEADDSLDLSRFQAIGVVLNKELTNWESIDEFMLAIGTLKKRGKWSKSDIVELLSDVMPSFRHTELNKYLDGKM